MLKHSLKITLDGESVVGEVSLAGFRAVIDSTNPKNMSLSVWQNDKDAYKEHRAQARKDQAEFEDLAYAKQDEMMR